jgi:hypothetical protein
MKTSGTRDLVDNPALAGEKKVQKEKVSLNENRKQGSPYFRFLTDGNIPLTQK